MLFHGVNGSVMCLPICCQRNIIIPTTDPFELRTSNAIHVLSSSKGEKGIKLQALFKTPARSQGLACLRTFHNADFMIVRSKGPRKGLYRLASSLKVKVGEFPIISSTSYHCIQVCLPTSALTTKRVIFCATSKHIPSIHIISRKVPLSRSSRNVHGLASNARTAYYHYEFPRKCISFSLKRDCQLAKINFYPCLGDRVRAKGRCRLLC